MKDIFVIVTIVLSYSFSRSHRIESITASPADFLEHTKASMDIGNVRHVHNECKVQVPFARTLSVPVPFAMIISTRLSKSPTTMDDASHNSLLFWASSAWWRRLGAVVLPSLLWTPCSMSAAHRAAPTVFVKEKKMPAMGTSSRRTAGTPKL
jgi:hypothetical protein